MLAFTISILTSVFLFLSILILASRRSAYSHLRDTISELGEFGAPDQRLAAAGIFLPVGLLLVLVAYLVRPIDQPPATLALCIAIGYLVAAAFPCDPGSPAWGTPRQLVHNLGGAAQYFGGFFALMRLSETLGTPFQIAGFIVGSVGFALSIPAVAPVRGLIQRVAEFCLFAGLTLAIGLENV
jgi:hypothetical protein